MSDELVTWLRAQLDEDERVVTAPPFRWDDDVIDWEACVQREAAWFGSWHTLHCGYRTLEFSEDCDCDVKDRVRAEIAAKRRILDLYDQDCPYGPDYWQCLNEVIEAMAQPYAGRGGWRDEWAAE